MKIAARELQIGDRVSNDDGATWGIVTHLNWEPPPDMWGGEVLSIEGLDEHLEEGETILVQR